MDIWWNPALEEQAIDRVHRIGQRLPVYVTRLMIDNTVEEKIIKLQEKKVKFNTLNFLLSSFLGYVI